MSDRIPAPSVVMTGQSGAGDDGKMVKLWLESFRSPHTRRGYEADAKAFRDFVCKPLAEVTVVDVLRFGDSLDHLASATAARRLAAVKSLIKMAHDVGYLDFDVGRVVTLPVVKDTLNERIMSEADVQKLLAAETQPRNAALLRLVYSAGLRISEACGLLWRDLRGDEGGEGGEITVL